MNLNQITVPSKDVPKAIEFYKKLGLKLIVHTHDHYARFECAVGDTTFSIHHSRDVTKKEGILIYFEVKDVDEAVSELIKKDIEFDQMPENKSWLWTEARLKDPDGNIIIIYHAGENRKNPPWRLQ
jgi:catechol 2,3-dioxygenase-like lactoylglutathione lyase family enzyme